MAIVNARQSDKSQKMIPLGTGARILIDFYDKTRVKQTADLSDEEIEELLPFATEIEERPARRRGRAEL